MAITQRRKNAARRPRFCYCVCDKKGGKPLDEAQLFRKMLEAIHSLFKLLVVLILNPEKVDAVISRLLFEVTEQAVMDTSDGSSPDEDEEDDCFKALMSPGPTAKEGYNSTRISNKMGKELESWCSKKQRNKLLEQAMFPAPSHPAWVDVFVKYNTAIPSSAAVERLFSQGSDIMKAKRASLTSDNFEILVFLHEGEHGPFQYGIVTRGL
ncbi:hypothetical protein GWK47_006974 [Chionoecetes opilio]|uniref:HAT C-terminal dimerisation domain-containing protein n=1 Tax=Chionoecetes opilio TaxID=41210 RepID=A0A8J4YF09_CHIOP|nr:hypothetical protein GWK47_006974 [Chionoecetes opilio]